MEELSFRIKITDLGTWCLWCHMFFFSLNLQMNIMLREAGLSQKDEERCSLIRNNLELVSLLQYRFGENGSSAFWSLDMSCPEGTGSPIQKLP